MVRMVLCKKLGCEAEGLEHAPFPGVKGQQIFETISKAAWLEWVGIQTMLINEHKLASFDPKAKKLIESGRFCSADGRTKVVIIASLRRKIRHWFWLF